MDLNTIFFRDKPNFAYLTFKQEEVTWDFAKLPPIPFLCSLNQNANNSLWKFARFTFEIRVKLLPSLAICRSRMKRFVQDIRIDHSDSREQIIIIWSVSNMNNLIIICRNFKYLVYNLKINNNFNDHDNVTLCFVDMYVSMYSIFRFYVVRPLLENVVMRRIIKTLG